MASWLDDADEDKRMRRENIISLFRQHPKKTISTKDINKVIDGTKSEIDSILYSLKSQGILQKVKIQPPEWCWVKPVNPNPSLAEVRPPVHKNMYALLVAGSDEDPKSSQLFCRDVESVYSVLTDRRIMGLGHDNVIQLVPNAADRCDVSNKKNIEKSFRKLLELSKDKKGVMILFYFSGHSDGKELQLNKSEDIKATKIKRELGKFRNAEEILVILDCCYASMANIAKGASAVPDLRSPRVAAGSKSATQLEGALCGIRQWSSSRHTQESVGDPAKGCSDFTEFVLKGLSSAQKHCDLPDCEACDTFKKRCEGDEYIWLAALQTYVYHHLKDSCAMELGELQQPTMGGVSSVDLRMAHYQSGRVFYYFNLHKNRQKYELKVQNLPDSLDELKILLQQTLDDKFGIKGHGIMTFYSARQGVLIDIEAIKNAFEASVSTVVVAKLTRN